MQSRHAVLAAILALVLPLPAAAHEFLIRPAATAAAAGETVGFQVLSTHVFFAPEEMEAGDSVTAELVSADGRAPVALSENAAEAMLEGSLEAPAGTAWLAAHRLGQVWSKTPEGWVQAGREEAPDAEFTNKYEKFAKVLMNPGDAGRATAPVGQLLEIVPLADPSGLAAGDTLPVQVLFDGQPVPAMVSATFDGFSDQPGTYAFLTEAQDGEAGPVAQVKLWSEGLWMVRAEHRTAETDGIDEHVLRSVMVFSVE